MNHLKRLIRGERYTVQLHRIGSPGASCSWQPITVRSLRDAHRTAYRLVAERRWGDALGWPQVVITDAAGRRVAGRVAA